MKYLDWLTNIWANNKPKATVNIIQPRNDMFLNLLKQRIMQINSFLSFSKETNAQNLVKDCFSLWAQTIELQSANNLADTVLANYYSQGKIADYIKKINSFIEDISLEDDPQITATMGYNNYIFFLDIYLKKIFENYETAQPDEINKIDCNIKSVCDFIKSECGLIPTIKDLPRAYSASLTVRENLKQNIPINPVLRSQILSAAELLDILEEKALNYDQQFEDILQLEELCEIYKKRLQGMQLNIQKSKELYNSLKCILTPEWISAFDPKSGSVCNMKTEEIKQFYIDSMQKVNEEILNKFAIE